MIDLQGTLYGTSSGGIRGGNIFSITTDGEENVIYNFAGSNGRQPLAGLIAVNGVLYGTTTMGGAWNRGTVFGVTKSGAESLLHSSRAGGSVNPQASLLAVSYIVRHDVW